VTTTPKRAQDLPNKFISFNNYKGNLVLNFTDSEIEAIQAFRSIEQFNKANTIAGNIV
jgi:hypothetical protein